jgi:hypothetical protein
MIHDDKITIYDRNPRAIRAEEFEAATNESRLSIIRQRGNAISVRTRSSAAHNGRMTSKLEA